MAKILIAGDVIVVTSSKKLEDIKTLEKYDPKSLSLFDEEDGIKTEVYKVGSTKGTGSINKYGASFGSEARDGSGLATITLPIPDGIEDVMEYTSDEVGFSLMKLNEIEAKMDAALDAVTSKKAAILENIQVM